jgi:hypothetical protein
LRGGHQSVCANNTCQSDLHRRFVL